jgi:hypothetical protein
MDKLKKKDNLTYNDLKTLCRKLKIEQHEPHTNKNEDELRVPLVLLVTNPMRNNEREKDGIAIMINGTYPWSFVIHIV